MIARSEKCFARDTAYVQTSATQFLVFFDKGGLQSELACSDRSDIAARPEPMITTSNFSNGFNT
jgi:hypothetical protein